MENKTKSYSQFLKQWRTLRPRARFSIPEILQWADAYYRRHGVWPQKTSGKVRGSLADFWSRVDDALRVGRRGLEGGSSLAKLLWEKRGVRNVYSKPRLTEQQILAWADAHHERTGKWPTLSAGAVSSTPDENWKNLNTLLREGLRGLKAGTSLAKLLHKHRGVRNPADMPRFKVADILAWADAHHERTGKWPIADSGPINESPGDTWSIVDGAFQRGRRGLPGNSSLARFLTQHRGIRHRFNRPVLTVEQLLYWADRHHERTGAWPSRAFSEPIPEAPDEKWVNLANDLRVGLRGLPRTTIRAILNEHRDTSYAPKWPKVTLEQILQWADLHHAHTGKWPHSRSGPVESSPGLTWSGLHRQLRIGGGGLPGSNSLSQVLAQHRGAPPSQRNKPPLSIKQILSWADDHHRRTRSWPSLSSGIIAAMPSERWHSIHRALTKGLRGLAGGQSLRAFLAEHRGLRHHKNPPLLNFVQVLAWADDFHKRKGRWPNWKDGAIKGSNGEKWSTVNDAFMSQRRGLRSGKSLGNFLHRNRGAPYRPAPPPPLKIEQILQWADAHHQRTNNWPSLAQYGDPVHEAPEINWRIVDRALNYGGRGLPGGTTLQQLLAERRGLRHTNAPPRLSVERILECADAHYQQTGSWPKTITKDYSCLPPGETWNAMGLALVQGHRGLPGKNSLARVLAKHRGARNHLALPRLHIEQILAWADSHYQKTGAWPHHKSGVVLDAPGEKWNSIQSALRMGARGFPGGQTVAQLLAVHRGVRNKSHVPPLDLKQIKKWASAHYQRTQRWPRQSDGPVADAPGETWTAIDLALRRGKRGLPGGSSLPALLAAAQANGKRDPKSRSRRRQK